MTSFSIHLPSDASLQEFPTNKISDFKVNIPSWPELEGDWEVAMTDLYYPASDAIRNVLEPAEFWVNEDEPLLLPKHLTPPPEIQARIEESYLRFGGNINRPGFVRYTIPADKYESPDQILLSKNNFSNHFSYEEKPGDLVEKHADKVLLFFDDDRKRTKLIINKHTSFKIRFGETLANLTGFIAHKDYGSGLHIAPRVWNSAWSSSSMYIYSPIVSPTIVGDVTAPLLRVVPVDYTPVRAAHVFAEFKRAHYVPLRSTRCNIIRILIYNEVGEKMQFKYGRVVVTLHFRPIIKNRDGLTL